MSKLQDDREYERFKSMNIFPVVGQLDTYGWEFGGKAKGLSKKAYPICQKDIEDLRDGKYDGHKYVIRDCPEETILVKHPFRPYELIPSDTSEHTIIKDHLDDLVMIFKALGAKECEATAKITEQQTLVIKGNGKIKAKTVKANGDFEQSKNTSKESDYKLIIKRNPDENNGYENAKRIAEKNGIAEAPEIKKILNLFDVEIGGKDKTYQLSENLTENYHKTLDLLIEVNASGTFDFKGKLNTDFKCRRTISINQTIYFE